MKKQLQNSVRNFLLLMLLVPFSSSVSAQVVNNQSFDAVTFPPTGWAGVGSITLWSRVPGGNNPNCTPHTGTGMGRFNSHTSVAGSTQTLSLPVVDLSGIGTDTAYFSFWIFRDNGVPTLHDSITISINTTQSMTGATRIGSVARCRLDVQPDSQSTNGWFQYSFDIPLSFNTATNYILMTGFSELGNNIFFDDVQWTSYPTLCSGTPTPGTINSVDTVLCGGTGSTTLSLSGHTTGTGITYQWKSGPSPTGPWTNFGTSVASVSTGTITSTTYYYNKITCSNSGLSDSTTVKHVTVSATPYPSVNITSSNNGYFCPAMPVQLIATGAATYSWSPSTNLNVTNNDTVVSTPTGSVGTVLLYTSTGMNAAGCIGTDTIHVTVVAATTIDIQAIPNDTICLGQLLILNGASLGGPTLGNFVWTPGGAITQSITISPGSDIIYNVHATNTYGCPTADTIPITVINSALPVINSITASNNGSYCNGLTPVTLTVSETGGAITTWSPSTGLNTTSGNTVLASPTGVGASILYAAIVANAGGCFVADTIRVYSHDLPVISITSTPNDTICVGESVTLMAVGTTVVDTILWMPTSSSSTSINVSPTTPTSYHLHVTSGITGCPNMDSVSIVPLAVPVSGFTFGQSGFIVTFTNTSTNATSYSWDFGDATSSTLQTPPPHTYAANGMYDVKLKVWNNGFCVDSSNQTVVLTVGINEIGNGGNFSAFLNQSNGVAYVQFNSGSEKVLLQVVNSVGQIVTERSISSNGNNMSKEEVDMNSLPGGVYSIHISSSSMNVSKKIIKY